MSFRLEGHLNFGLDSRTGVLGRTVNFVIKAVVVEREVQTWCDRVLNTNRCVGQFNVVRSALAKLVLGINAAGVQADGVADTIDNAVRKSFFLACRVDGVNGATDTSRDVAHGDGCTGVCAVFTVTNTVKTGNADGVGYITHGTRVARTVGSGAVVVGQSHVTGTDTKAEAGEGRAVVVEGSA